MTKKIKSVELLEKLWCGLLFILGQEVKNHNKHIHNLRCWSKLSWFSWFSPLNILRLMIKKLNMLLLPEILATGLGVTGLE